MVDATAVSRDTFDAPSKTIAERPTAWAMVHHAGSAGLDSYRAHCTQSVHAPAQSALWVSSYVAEAAPDYVIASLRIDGVALFAVPIEIVREGSLTVGRYMSGSHANGNFAPGCPKWLAGATIADMRALVQSVKAARPDVDLLRFERQEAHIGGYPNPLLLLASSVSPNPALAVDLSAGFDGLLERISGKRKLKKHRAQIRAFEASGGYEIRRASDAGEVEDFLRAFLVMKAHRFAAMGIENVFAPPAVQRFLTRLFTDALSCEEPPFYLEALVIGGTIRSVTATSLAGDRVVCEFGAIREDELIGQSPGEYLFFKSIQNACASGLSSYDFSVGDEPYKRQWGAEDRRQHDSLVPLSPRGHVAAWRLAGEARLKRGIKESRVLWPIVQRFRRKLAGRAVPHPEKED